MMRSRTAGKSAVRGIQRPGDGQVAPVSIETVAAIQDAQRTPASQMGNQVEHDRTTSLRCDHKHQVTGNWVKNGVHAPRISDPEAGFNPLKGEKGVKNGVPKRGICIKQGHGAME